MALISLTTTISLNPTLNVPLYWLKCSVLYFAPNSHYKPC
jgi:hypothetical protein